MRRGIVIVVALAAFIGTGGGVAGVGLANYAASGSFEFYKQQRSTDWQAEPPPQPATLQTSDLAFASDRRAAPDRVGADYGLASLNP